MKPGERNGLRICFVPARGVIVRITVICLTEERLRRAHIDQLAFLYFIVDREVTCDEDPWKTLRQTKGSTPTKGFLGAGLP
jgi:hypothetical protein